MYCRRGDKVAGVVVRNALELKLTLVNSQLFGTTSGPHENTGDTRIPSLCGIKYPHQLSGGSHLEDLRRMHIFVLGPAKGLHSAHPDICLVEQSSSRVPKTMSELADHPLHGGINHQNHKMQTLGGGTITRLALASFAEIVAVPSGG